MPPGLRCLRLLGATNASAVIPTVASECGRAGDGWGRRGPGQKGRGRQGLPHSCSRGPGSSRRRRSSNFMQCARRRRPRCVGRLKSVEGATSGTHMASAGKKNRRPAHAVLQFPAFSRAILDHASAPFSGSSTHLPTELPNQRRTTTRVARKGAASQAIGATAFLGRVNGGLRGATQYGTDRRSPGIVPRSRK